MSQPRLPLTLLVGHPRPDSRTLAVARLAAATLHGDLRRQGVDVSTPALIDLAALLPHLTGDPADGQLTHALASVRDSRLLIVVSPTFKASFSGALKLFLDQLPYRGLANVVAVPVMTAACRLHLHVVDTFLRPLLLELGAAVPTTGLCVLEHHLADPQPVLDAWSEDTVPALMDALTSLTALNQ